MKNMQNILVAFCIIIGIPLFGYSQFTDTREYEKRFKVDKETRIEIYNKYGKIEINTWEKDSAVFKIDLRVEERKLIKLERTMEEIDIDFTNSNHFLIARTKVNTGSSQLMRELLKMKETILQTDGNVEINYKVWLPKSCNLVVENKYGNIYIDEFLGDVDINLSNGNLKVHEFSGNTKLTLNFADATINKVKDARIISSYSDIYLKEANDLRLESKQSNYEILEMGDLKADTQRDKFRIRMVDMIDADGTFSNFRVTELRDRINLQINYGDLDVEKIYPEFSTIFVESKSTDINLYFEPNSNFKFDITHTKTEVDFCRKVEVTEEVVLDEKEGKKQIKGTFGESKSAKEKLFINAFSGEINLMAN